MNNKITTSIAAIALSAASASTISPALAAGHKPGRSHSHSRSSRPHERFVIKQSGGCKALAPADWTMVAGSEGAGVDMLSSD